MSEGRKRHPSPFVREGREGVAPQSGVRDGGAIGSRPEPVAEPNLSGELRNGTHYLPVRVYYEDTDFSGLPLSQLGSPAPAPCSAAI
jgi:hypothetical protein